MRGNTLINNNKLVTQGCRTQKQYYVWFHKGILHFNIRLNDITVNHTVKNKQVVQIAQNKSFKTIFFSCCEFEKLLLTFFFMILSWDWDYLRNVCCLIVVFLSVHV